MQLDAPTPHHCVRRLPPSDAPERGEHTVGRETWISVAKCFGDLATFAILGDFRRKKLDNRFRLGDVDQPSVTRASHMVDSANSKKIDKRSPTRSV